MRKLSNDHAADYSRFSRNLQLMKAFVCTCSVLAILSLSTGSTLAAESSVVAPGAKLEKSGEGYSFTDGPAADSNGNVFFTDTLNNRIIKWSATDGMFSDWLKPAGSAVGTYFDKGGNLIVAASEKGELWSIAPDKTVTVLVTDFDGKVFNGPNDLWIRPDGGIYFTDPELYASHDQSTLVDVQAVYFVTPDHKTALSTITVPQASDAHLRVHAARCWTIQFAAGGRLTMKYRLAFKSEMALLGR